MGLLIGYQCTFVYSLDLELNIGNVPDFDCKASELYKLLPVCMYCYCPILWTFQRPTYVELWSEKVSNYVWLLQICFLYSRGWLPVKIACTLIYVHICILWGVFISEWVFITVWGSKFYSSFCYMALYITHFL